MRARLEGLPCRAYHAGPRIGQTPPKPTSGPSVASDTCNAPRPLEGQSVRFSRIPPARGKLDTWYPLVGGASHAVKIFSRIFNVRITTIVVAGKYPVENDSHYQEALMRMILISNRAC